MPPTCTRICRNYSALKAIFGLFVVVALAVALMAIGLKGMKKIKAPEVVKASVPVRQNDMLSATDAREWRQEFLSHRKVPKVCPNPWIDEQQCVRMTGRL
jgi:hypothetical protein